MGAKAILFIGFESNEQIEEYMDTLPAELGQLNVVSVNTSLTGPNTFSRASAQVMVPGRYRASGREMECFQDGIIAGMKQQIVQDAFGDLSPKDVIEVIHLVEAVPGDPEVERVHMKWLIDLLPASANIRRIESALV